jgi:hypothetical protein
MPSCWLSRKEQRDFERWLFDPKNDLGESAYAWRLPACLSTVDHDGQVAFNQLHESGSRKEVGLGYHCSDFYQSSGILQIQPASEPSRRGH